MSKLPQVEFAPDAPPALDCIIALTKCTIGGEIDDALVEDPSNVWMNVSRVVDTGLDMVPKKDANGLFVMKAISEEEAHAWADYAVALEAGDDVTLRIRSQPQALSANDIPWDLIIQLSLAAFQRFAQRWRDRRQG